jgi:hypothetical protein
VCVCVCVYMSVSVHFCLSVCGVAHVHAPLWMCTCQVCPCMCASTTCVVHMRACGAVCVDTISSRCSPRSFVKATYRLVGSLAGPCPLFYFFSSPSPYPCVPALTKDDEGVQTPPPTPPPQPHRERGPMYSLSSAPRTGTWQARSAGPAHLPSLQLGYDIHQLMASELASAVHRKMLARAQKITELLAGTDGAVRTQLVILQLYVYSCMTCCCCEAVVQPTALVCTCPRRKQFRALEGT